MLGSIAQNRFPFQSLASQQVRMNEVLTSMQRNIMNHYTDSLVRAASMVALFAATLSSSAQNTVGKVLVGNTKVTMVHSYSGKDKLPKPTQITVFDFDLPIDVVTIDRSMEAHILNHDPIAHIIHVIVSLTAPSSPVLVAEFDLESASGKKPGAAATMGVGSAAASVGTSTATDSKTSVEGDTTRMAKTVATEIEDLMIAQQWIPPMKT